MLTVGVDTLPPLPKDAGDRNRTSPFAFTGNKFEFRAVGSSQSVAGPLVILNTIMADSLDYIATELEAAKAKGSPKELGAAVQKVIQKIIKEHGRDDLQRRQLHRSLAEGGREARACRTSEIQWMRSGGEDTRGERRGLAQYNVLSEREFHSRNEIYLEKYVKEVMTEGGWRLKSPRR